jgi:hypothetical protein
MRDVALTDELMYAVCGLPLETLDARGCVGLCMNCTERDWELTQEQEVSQVETAAIRQAEGSSAFKEGQKRILASLMSAATAPAKQQKRSRDDAKLVTAVSDITAKQRNEMLEVEAEVEKGKPKPEKPEKPEKKSMLEGGRVAKAARKMLAASVQGTAQPASELVFSMSIQLRAQKLPVAEFDATLLGYAERFRRHGRFHRFVRLTRQAAWRGSLTSLDLADSDVTSLSGISSCQALRRLVLDRTNLSSRDYMVVHNLACQDLSTEDTEWNFGLLSNDVVPESKESNGPDINPSNYRDPFATANTMRVTQLRRFNMSGCRGLTRAGLRFMGRQGASTVSLANLDLDEAGLAAFCAGRVDLGGLESLDDHVLMAHDWPPLGDTPWRIKMKYEQPYALTQLDISGNPKLTGQGVLELWRHWDRQVSPLVLNNVFAQLLSKTPQYAHTRETRQYIAQFQRQREAAGLRAPRLVRLIAHGCDLSSVVVASLRERGVVVDMVGPAKPPSRVVALRELEEVDSDEDKDYVPPPPPELTGVYEYSSGALWQKVGDDDVEIEDLVAASDKDPKIRALVRRYPTLKARAGLAIDDVIQVQQVYTDQLLEFRVKLFNGDTIILSQFEFQARAPELLKLQMASLTAQQREAFSKAAAANKTEHVVNILSVDEYGHPIVGTSEGRKQPLGESFLSTVLSQELAAKYDDLLKTTKVLQYMGSLLDSDLAEVKLEFKEPRIVRVHQAALDQGVIRQYDDRVQRAIALQDRKELEALLADSSPAYTAYAALNATLQEMDVGWSLDSSSAPNSFTLTRGGEERKGVALHQLPSYIRPREALYEADADVFYETVSGDEQRMGKALFQTCFPNLWATLQDKTGTRFGDFKDAAPLIEKIRRAGRMDDLTLSGLIRRRIFVKDFEHVKRRVEARMKVLEELDSSWVNRANELLGVMVETTPTSLRQQEQTARERLKQWLADRGEKLAELPSLPDLVRRAQQLVAKEKADAQTQAALTELRAPAREKFYEAVTPNWADVVAGKASAVDALRHARGEYQRILHIMERTPETQEQAQAALRGEAVPNLLPDFIAQSKVPKSQSTALGFAGREQEREYRDFVDAGLIRMGDPVTEITRVEDELRGWFAVKKAEGKHAKRIAEIEGLRRILALKATAAWRAEVPAPRKSEADRLREGVAIMKKMDEASGNVMTTKRELFAAARDYFQNVYPEAKRIDLDATGTAGRRANQAIDTMMGRVETKLKSGSVEDLREALTVFKRFYPELEEEFRQFEEGRFKRDKAIALFQKIVADWHPTAYQDRFRRAGKSAMDTKLVTLGRRK